MARIKLVNSKLVSSLLELIEENEEYNTKGLQIINYTTQYDGEDLLYRSYIYENGKRFSVELTIMEDYYDSNYIIEGNCSCDSMYECKHTVFFANHLIEKIGGDHVPIILKNNEKEFLRLSRTSAIDYLSGVEKKYKQPVTINIEKNNSLAFEFKDPQSRSYYADTFNLEMRLDAEGELEFYCFQCQKLSLKFHCSHLISMLNISHIPPLLKSYCNKAISYDKIYGKFKKSIGIDSDEFKDLIQLYLKDEKNFYYTNNDPNLILSESDLSKANLSINDNPSDDATMKKHLDEIVDRKFAVLWSQNGAVRLLTGRKSKKGDSIVGIEIERTFRDAPEALAAALINIKSLWEIEKHSLIVDYVLNNIALFNNYENFFLDKNIGEYSDSFNRSDLIEFNFHSFLATLVTKIDRNNSYVNFNVSLSLDEGSIALTADNKVSPFFFIVDGIAYLTMNNSSTSISNLRNLKVVNSPALIQSMVTKYSQLTRIEYDQAEEVYDYNVKRQIHIREVSSFIIFEPSIVFDDKYKKTIFDNSQIVDIETNTLIQLDEQVFLDFRQWIANIHPSWKYHSGAQSYYYLSPKELVHNFWFLHFFEKAKEANIEIFGQEKLSNLKYNTNQARVKTNVSSGIDWFKADVEISFGNQTVDQKDWYESIKNNEKFVKLADGSIGILPEEWFNKLKKLVSVSDKDGNKLKINKLKFFIIDELFQDIDDAKLRKELDDKKKALASYTENKKYKLPKQLQAELRPYQKSGFQWLKFCNEYGFGGCLADDMGLGKTVQVIALLIDQVNDKKPTSLVVVPKSLLFNWAAELDKFAPSIKYYLHHGHVRSKEFNVFLEYDVVISTYDTITRDIEGIKQIAFNYAILDESQAIKNVSSQRYKAMRIIQSKHKLVMTGTPIENNTFDLYAQFSFLNPGFLGSVKQFTENFSTPIDALGSQEAAHTLKNMIHPFLLRRTKEKVAKDLPSKTEAVIYCDMGDEQRKQYESLRLKIKEDVESAIETQGLNNSKFKVLEGLLRLRQMCNSPELVDGTLPDKLKQSVKIDTLVEQLGDELGEHKALVFSQFVTMLDLIKKQLDYKKIKYAYLDGSTNDRAAAVNDFMDNDDCNVFLLSLKAGNAGLNLTKADYVYIVDPWWNPAVEAQAVDRTHRIGQTKNIFSYRLICRDTIEEKIVELQSKKKKLSADLIQADENIFKSLDKGELMSLFG